MSGQEQRPPAPTSPGHTVTDQAQLGRGCFPHFLICDWGLGTSSRITRPGDRLHELTRGEPSVEQLLPWGGFPPPEAPTPSCSCSSGVPAVLASDGSAGVRAPQPPRGWPIPGGAAGAQLPPVEGDV